MFLMWVNVPSRQNTGWQPLVAAPLQLQILQLCPRPAGARRSWQSLSFVRSSFLPHSLPPSLSPSLLFSLSPSLPDGTKSTDIVLVLAFLGVHRWHLGKGFIQVI